VSAEDNYGIGGYDRVMGPNGQAQYWAPNLAAACDVLMAHYEHTYLAPGETAPRQAASQDPRDRDVSGYPHAVPGSDFATVGEIFSAAHNPDRKKPFDIRAVMRALSDQDHLVLERWAGMADADMSVVQDVHLGGWPVCLIGIESQNVPRRGFPPTDGPDTYTAGTLFPRSSKKTARAINAASGNRPLVVLANLSGFDGSPESMRKLQLEYGAEIGRAIVNFRGPIVFCVISRYHGGAFVVFSKSLNPNLTVLALEGSFASVLGGAPAAAVVFSGEVRDRTATDPRVAGLQARAAETSGAERAALHAELAEVQAAVRAEKVGEVAAEFDRIHSIQRAVQVGSVDEIICAPGSSRPSSTACTGDPARPGGHPASRGGTVDARDHVRGAGVPHRPQGFLAGATERVADRPRGTGPWSLYGRSRPPPVQYQPRDPRRPHRPRHRPDRARIRGHRPDRPGRPAVRDGHGRRHYHFRPSRWVAADQRRYVPDRHPRRRAAALAAGLPAGAGRPAGRPL
jgi:hypothetical protein